MAEIDITPIQDDLKRFITYIRNFCKHDPVLIGMIQEMKRKGFLTFIEVGFTISVDRYTPENIKSGNNEISVLKLTEKDTKFLSELKIKLD